MFSGTVNTASGCAIPLLISAAVGPVEASSTFSVILSTPLTAPSTGVLVVPMNAVGPATNAVASGANSMAPKAVTTARYSDENIFRTQISPLERADSCGLPMCRASVTRQLAVYDALRVESLKNLYDVYSTRPRVSTNGAFCGGIRGHVQLTRLRHGEEANRLEPYIFRSTRSSGSEVKES